MTPPFCRSRLAGEMTTAMPGDLVRLRRQAGSYNSPTDFD